MRQEDAPSSFHMGEFRPTSLAPDERAGCMGMMYIHLVERWKNARSRVIKLGQDDGAMDRYVWQESTIDERIAAVWDITLECLAWSNFGADQPRLQRSVCRIERRGR